MRDLFTSSLNAPPGRLAEVLISKVTKGDRTELPDDLRARLDRLVEAPGRSGLLALVRLAVDVPFLFDRAPSWTTSRIIPLFDWSSPDTTEIWSARKYSNYIGSPVISSTWRTRFGMPSTARQVYYATR